MVRAHASRFHSRLLMFFDVQFHRRVHAILLLYSLYCIIWYGMHCTVEFIAFFGVHFFFVVYIRWLKTFLLSTYAIKVSASFTRKSSMLCSVWFMSKSEPRETHSDDERARTIRRKQKKNLSDWNFYSSHASMHNWKLKIESSQRFNFFFVLPFFISLFSAVVGLKNAKENIE